MMIEVWRIPSLIEEQLLAIEQLHERHTPEEVAEFLRNWSPENLGKQRSERK